MLDLLFDFSSGFGSFINAFFFPFYYSIRFLLGFTGSDFPVRFFICLITQIVLIIIILVFAKGKDANIFISFLLCLALPLISVFAILALRPTIEVYEDSSPEETDPNVEQKICKTCGKRVNADIFVCPSCRGESFR